MRVRLEVRIEKELKEAFIRLSKVKFCSLSQIIHLAGYEFVDKYKKDLGSQQLNKVLKNSKTRLELNNSLADNKSLAHNIYICNNASKRVLHMLLQPMIDTKEIMKYIKNLKKTAKINKFNRVQWKDLLSLKQVDLEEIRIKYQELKTRIPKKVLDNFSIQDIEEQYIALGFDKRDGDMRRQFIEIRKLEESRKDG